MLWARGPRPTASASSGHGKGPHTSQVQGCLVKGLSKELVQLMDKKTETIHMDVGHVSITTNAVSDMAMAGHLSRGECCPHPFYLLSS